MMPRTPKEIAEINARGRGHQGVEYEISKLRIDVESLGERAGSFLDLVPIRLVTIIEQAIRGIVQDAVDHGQPYSDRGITMISRWSGKTIASALLAISEKEITLGQLAAHGFSVGRLPDIISTLSILFDCDLPSQIGMIKTRWVESVHNPDLPIVENKNLTLSMMDRLLTVRHILVHEIPKIAPYGREDIFMFLDHTEKFLKALLWIKVEKLYGAVPYSQTEMNRISANEVAKVAKEFYTLRGGTPSEYESPEDELQELEYHWDKFCDLAAQKYAGYLEKYAVGTMAPMLYASAKKYMLLWRMEQFKLYSNS